MAREVDRVDLPQPDPEGDDEILPPAGDTSVIPRIESAIPAGDDPARKVVSQDELPRLGHLALAALASAALVIGLALYITHPWNPDQYSISATEEADTSMAGFPGTVEALSGQDSNEPSSQELRSGDEATLELLRDSWQLLGDYARRADENAAAFDELAFGGDDGARQAGEEAAHALALDVSNLIVTIEGADVTSGTYADERQNLLSLGNWLRNRSDALTAAWEAARQSTDLAADEPHIRELEATAGTSSEYATLFDEQYGQWEPKARD